MLHSVCPTRCSCTPGLKTSDKVSAHGALSLPYSVQLHSRTEDIRQGLQESSHAHSLVGNPISAGISYCSRTRKRRELQFQYSMCVCAVCVCVCARARLHVRGCAVCVCTSAAGFFVSGVVYRFSFFFLCLVAFSHVAKLSLSVLEAFVRSLGS